MTVVALAEAEAVTVTVAALAGVATFMAWYL